MGCVNDWKLTPMAVAYLKGHIGLANILLDESNGWVHMLHVVLFCAID